MKYVSTPNRASPTRVFAGPCFMLDLEKGTYDSQKLRVALAMEVTVPVAHTIFAAQELEGPVIFKSQPSLPVVYQFHEQYAVESPIH